MRNLSVILLLLVVGCATGLTTKGQKAFQAESDYKAALAVAVTYKSLPDCPTSIICKKPEIVKQLQDADDVAFPSLQSAQACIRANCPSSALAIDAANSAVAALTTITSKLQVK